MRSSLHILYYKRIRLERARVSSLSQNAGPCFRRNKCTIGFIRDDSSRAVFVSPRPSPPSRFSRSVHIMRDYIVPFDTLYTAARGRRVQHNIVTAYRVVRRRSANPERTSTFRKVRGNRRFSFHTILHDSAQSIVGNDCEKVASTNCILARLPVGSVKGGSWLNKIGP